MSNGPVRPDRIVHGFDPISWASVPAGRGGNSPVRRAVTIHDGVCGPTSVARRFGRHRSGSASAGPRSPRPAGAASRATRPAWPRSWPGAARRRPFHSRPARAEARPARKSISSRSSPAAGVNRARAGPRGRSAGRVGRAWRTQLFPQRGDPGLEPAVGGTHRTPGDRGDLLQRHPAPEPGDDHLPLLRAAGPPGPRPRPRRPARRSPARRTTGPGGTRRPPAAAAGGPTGRRRWPGCGPPGTATPPGPPASGPCAASLAERVLDHVLRARHTTAGRTAPGPPRGESIRLGEPPGGHVTFSDGGPGRFFRLSAQSECTHRNSDASLWTRSLDRP